ncbi:Panacea domain-containing protein [Foetidibacter luteolus]|uniref:Panacea domain-containing protein n=1 Tax=Foetidibacter luteolus TaxID=2608880 RepID=UPI001A998F72|nr:Panacea domain-containing protein [Foetidibacter luteolus]
MTKALKLLYLIDETSYVRSGAPVTWLDYKVWEMGPVAEELYNELRYDQTLVQNGEAINLSNFIEAKREKGFEGQEQVVIYPKGTYQLNEFSAFEKELIENVVDRFGYCSARQLIDILHQEKTLWHKCVTDNHLKENFRIYGKKSNHSIDFTDLIISNPILQMAAQSAFESMQMQEELDNLDA